MRDVVVSEMRECIAEPIQNPNGQLMIQAGSVFQAHLLFGLPISERRQRLL
jgi:hypothetical protein